MSVGDTRYTQTQIIKTQVWVFGLTSQQSSMVSVVPHLGKETTKMSSSLTLEMNARKDIKCMHLKLPYCCQHGQ